MTVLFVQFHKIASNFVGLLRQNFPITGNIVKQFDRFGSFFQAENKTETPTKDVVS